MVTDASVCTPHAVMGNLNGASAAQFTHLLAAFRKGSSETGHVEGRNVTVEYRYADGEYNRLPALAADLVDRRVAAIVATAGTPTILPSALKGVVPTNYPGPMSEVGHERPRGSKPHVHAS